MNKINCKICKYYKITWKPKKPHACSAYNFESKEIPSLVIKKTTGTPCYHFEVKNNKKLL